jgi:hypothetical protein
MKNLALQQFSKHSGIDILHGEQMQTILFLQPKYNIHCGAAAGRRVCKARGWVEFRAVTYLAADIST